MLVNPNTLKNYGRSGDPATLEFDFRSGAVDSRLAFTRASSATYVDSTTGLVSTAATDVPRFQTSGSIKGLLMEGPRTNIALYSEQFDNAAWTAAGVSISANADVAPDGTTTADRIIENTATSPHEWYQAVTGSAGANINSIYAKAGTRNWLHARSNSDAAFAYFDLTNGVLGTVAGGLTATITHINNGWYRCTVSASAGVTYTAFGLADSDGNHTYLGNGTGYISVWGAQYESGVSFASSYIATTSVSVSRSADILGVADVSSWFNQAEGTLYIEQVPMVSSGSFVPLNFDNGADTMHISVSSDGGNGYGTRVYVTPVNTYSHQFGGSGLSAAGVSAKISFGFKLNDFRMALNGTLGTLDTSGAMTTGITNLKLGRDQYSTANLFGELRQFKYWNTRKPDAKLSLMSSRLTG